MNDILSTLRPADLLRLAIKETERRLTELRNALELIDGKEALDSLANPKRMEECIRRNAVPQVVEPVKRKSPPLGFKYNEYSPARDAVLQFMKDKTELFSIQAIADGAGVSRQGVYGMKYAGYLEQAEVGKYQISELGRKELVRVEQMQKSLIS